METDTSTSKITDIFLNLFFLFAGYIIIVEVILPMLFKKTGGGCGGESGNDFFEDSELDAREKACIAVGMCATTGSISGKHVSTVQISKWKNDIMNGAEKIFGKQKEKATPKNNPTKKKRK